MNNIYKEILKDSTELKSLKTLHEVFNKIHRYVKEKFIICDFKIVLENKDHSEILFESSKEILEHKYKYKTKIKITQNDYIEINYLIYTKNSNVFGSLRDKEEELQLLLEGFSQTIYIKYLELQNNKLSLTDKVTGLHNRHYLDNYIDNILNISNREQKKVGFLKISIDKFKAVIDEFDYTVGDSVLKALSRQLLETVRSSDIVVKFEGGDFLVILLNVINENNAIMISEKIINNFGKQKIIVNDATKQTLTKTVCIGVSIYPDDGTNIDDIIKKSDIALYEAKNKGRSKVYKYTENEAHTIDFF